MTRDTALPLSRVHPERGHKCRECALFIAEKDVSSIDASRVPTDYCIFHEDTYAPGKEACRRFKPRERGKRIKGHEVLWLGKEQYPRIIKDKYGREWAVLNPGERARRIRPTHAK